MSHPVQKSDQEWQAVLSPGKLICYTPHHEDPSANNLPEQFRIIRQKGTEAPFSGALDKHFADSGAYSCAACNAPLYKADHKFKSGCGWPAFFDAVPGAVERHTDRAFGMERTEIVCSNCGGHLGHVFKGEGYPTPTDERHCVNSVSIKFAPEDKVVDKTETEDKKVTTGENAKV
jgi:peptide-methionine (R)-S-oxide reductase